jgi:invasion protein IalB
MRTLTAGRIGSVVLRIGLVVLILILGAVIGAVADRLLSGPASNEVRVRTFMDWRVICPPVTPETPNCALTEDVLRDTGGILATISMNDPSANGQLSLTVPHGVLLESGLGFSIGTEPMRVRPYETCTTMGCVALVTVDADTLKSLSSNMQAQFTVAVPNTPQPVNVPFSLNGFADGYAELKRAKARRTSFFRLLYR